MKAIAFSEFGGRKQLKRVEIPRPVPGRGEVLIRVRAAGVNPVDWKIREGLLRTRLPHLFPVIPGWDAAGTIAAVGAGVRRFRRGQAVYAYARQPIVHAGAYAEYLVLPQTSVAPKPRNLSFIEAASIPLAGLTAYQCLFDAAALRRGQTMLIHAAAGGVGGFAVQLAKQRGAYVIATASRAKHRYVLSLGADEVIDYRAIDFRKAVRDLHPGGVDAAFDTVGGEVQRHSAEIVRRGGVLVSILPFEDPSAVKRRGVRPAYVFVAPHARQLQALARLAEQGRLRTQIAKVFPLDQAAQAQALIERGHTTGKIVLRV